MVVLNPNRPLLSPLRRSAVRWLMCWLLIIMPTACSFGLTSEAPNASLSNPDFDDLASCESRLLFDPEHCGRCNASCFGASCVEGTCALVDLGRGGEPSLSFDASVVLFRAETGLTLLDRRTSETRLLAKNPSESGLGYLFLSSDAQRASFLWWDGAMTDGSSLCSIDLATMEKTQVAAGRWLGPYRLSRASNGLTEVFVSRESLTEDDTDSELDVFVHDVTQQQLTRIQLAAYGLEPHPTTQETSLSGNARYIAFNATVAGGFERRPDERLWNDVYLLDRELQQIENLGPGYLPLLSEDASIVVVFRDQESESDELGVWNSLRVIDRQQGTVENACAGPDEIELQPSCDYHSLSLDGRYLAYALRLNGGTRESSTWRCAVAVRDLRMRKTIVVEATKSSGQWCPLEMQLSGDGRFVSFVSRSPTLVDDESYHVFVVGVPAFD